MSSHDQEERLRPLFFFVASFVAAVILLGGVNVNDAPANAVLQYAAAPLLCVALYHIGQAAEVGGAIRGALTLICASLLLALIQIIPLPEALWRQLPFHDHAISVLALLDAPHSGGYWSLAPFSTWISLLALLPALALFLSVLVLTQKERRWLIAVTLAMGVASAFLGLLQFSQNTARGAYLYPNMGAGDVVGFFANRNHFAALMYALTPFSVACVALALSPSMNATRPEQPIKARAASRGRRTSSAQNERWNWGDAPLLFAGAATLFVFVVCGVMARSRAGVILLMLALLAVSLLPRWRDLGKNAAASWVFSRLFIGVAGFSLLFALEYGFFRLLARFETDPLQDARLRIAKNTWNAALAAFPAGTGFGTFQRIYAVIEPTQDVTPYAYVNHAHNEYLELMLEAGAPALLIMGGFFIWFLSRVRAVWTAEAAPDYFARAASLAIALLLLHSFVDYPLRTHALFGLFALSCALLAPPVLPRADTAHAAGSST